MLFDALAIAAFIMAAFSLPLLLVAIFLPSAQRKKLLHRLGRKWII
jgi:hypothetical protein